VKSPTFRSDAGPFMHEPVALNIGSVYQVMRSSASTLTHQSRLRENTSIQMPGLNT